MFLLSDKIKKYIIIVYLSFIFSFYNSIQSMQFIDYYASFSPLSDNHPDYNVYDSLKKNPLQGNITFFAIPWGHLRVNKNYSLITTIKNIPSYSNSFTICGNVREIIPYVKQLNIKTIFSPHVTFRDHAENIDIIPMPFFPLQGVGPAKNKDILVSFIGIESSHSIRKKIFAIKKHPGMYIKKRSQWNYFIKDKNRQRSEQEEYKNVLSRSQFALCPRGYSPGSIRFWEALQAGAIPILIDDPIKLPAGVDWDKCIIRISAKNLTNLCTILKKYSNEEIELKKNACIEAYEKLCLDMATCIRMYYEEVV